jgi:hypothetical protein
MEKEEWHMRVIDPKFHIEDEKIIKTPNGEILLEDEPLFLLRARDNLALDGLREYRQTCIEAGCIDYQLEGIDERILAFEKFAIDHPERMKQPGITRGK